MFDDDAPPLPAGMAMPLTGDTDDSRAENEVLRLFDQVRGQLMRYLLSLGLSAGDAEEVTQEAFLALFQHLRARKPGYNLRAWIFRVCHNMAVKRKSVLRRNLPASFDENVVDSALNPEDSFAQNQRIARVAGVWRALPEVDRRCLALRAEGLTYREISEVLQISLGAVSNSVARSLMRFARAVER